MPMYNLLEYSDNYSTTSGSLWNYYRDEVNNETNENIDAGNYRKNNSKTMRSKSFEYMTKIIGSFELRWAKNCIISEISRTAAATSTGANFK